MDVQLPAHIAVRCTSNAEAKRLMRELNEYTSILWYSDATPSEDKTYWKPSDTSIVYNIEHGRMSYGTGHYARNHNIPIVSFYDFLGMLHVFETEEDDVAIDLATVL